MDYTTLKGKVEVRYFPDSYTETEIRDGASWPLGAGRYEVGVDVDGAWLPLAGFKGGGVQKKLAAAAAARSSAPADTATSAGDSA